MTEIDTAREDSGSEWRTWLVVMGLAMLFGLIESAQLRLGSSVLGHGLPITVALARVLPFWAIAALVILSIVAIGRRFRVWQFLLRPNLPAVAATATGFAVLALAGRALLATTAPEASGALRPTPLQLFQTYFPLDLLTYTAFVGSLYAFHYYREARRREITASQLQARLAEAHLGGLEARIDPEFLFNTLNDISALASQGQQTPVIDMLGRLSEVLRAALSDQRPEEIPLQQELALLDGYVKMNASEMSRRDEVHTHVASDVMGALVPRMILPTLAERVLRRGKHEHNDACRVAVHAARTDEMLRLEVTIAATETRRGGEWQEQEISLDGIREQFQRLYGCSQSIDLSTRDTGVVAVVTVPFREALAGESAASA
ncbi:MAG TPA: sensor histidine kinase [Vicinamibacterales bacterium]